VLVWSHRFFNGSPFKQSIDSNEDGKRDTSFASTRSTPIRPHTRSQTGTVLKRRIPDDVDVYAEPKKRATTARKKPKKFVTGEQLDAQSSSSSSPKLPVTRHPSLGSVSTTSRDPLSAPQITFWHASPASDDQHELGPRLPRSRATLPTPIPNLTKKSRGRRVPTQESSRTTTDQKATRLYVCQVEGCGKCFQRGEHLKRHIRSIHTHEKRELSRNDICHSWSTTHLLFLAFQCTYPQCEKYFNRHDNLLQHYKVHREPHERSTLPSLSPHPDLGDVQVYASQRAESPMNELESPVSPRIPYRQISSSPYHAHSAPYSVPAEPNSRITNMAVSSLRTVLPHSPTENRTNFMPSARQYCS